MSDDIRPGDVVVCVDAKLRSISFSRTMSLQEGALYRVATCDITGLGFATVHLREIKTAAPKGFYADRFRKIDAADDEFIAQVRACRPIKIGEPA